MHISGNTPGYFFLALYRSGIGAYTPYCRNNIYICKVELHYLNAREWGNTVPKSFGSKDAVMRAYQEWSGVEWSGMEWGLRVGVAVSGRRGRGRG